MDIRRYKLARTGSRAPDPFPLSSQFLQCSIPTGCFVYLPLEYLRAAISAKGMLRTVSAYKRLGAIEFGQIIKTLLVTPAKGCQCKTDRKRNILTLRNQYE